MSDPLETGTYDSEIEKTHHSENFEKYNEEELDELRTEHLVVGECGFCHMPAETTPTHLCACPCHAEGGD